MKKNWLILSVAALFMTACASKKDDKNGGTHTHEDGTVHENHDDTLNKQEEFKAAADTSSGHDHDKEHSHDDHEHPHTHR